LVLVQLCGDTGLDVLLALFFDESPTVGPALFLAVGIRHR
jgi:hypothetical protein